MCLNIVENVRKDKIKYIYKVFVLSRKKLRAYYQYHYIYKPGYNYPRGKIDVQRWVVRSGVLHAHRSVNELSSNLYDVEFGVAIRLPVVREDILYCGHKCDVGLGRLFIPESLYERVIKKDKPNITLNTGMKVYW